MEQQREKVSNPLGILKRSALSEYTKVSTENSEVMRRMKNCLENCDKGVVEEMLLDYMENLCGMRYSFQWRSKVLRSTQEGYKKVMEMVGRGETRRNREEKTTSLSSRLIGPSTRFRTNKWKAEEELVAGDPSRARGGKRK